MNRLLIASATTLLLLLGTAAQAQTVRLRWDPNPQPEVTGYVIEYGTTSHHYTESMDVGNVTEVAVQGLTVGRTYYFAVRAYSADNNGSPRSREVTATVRQLTTGLLPGRSELFWRHSATGEVAGWKLDRTTQVSGSTLGTAVADKDWRIVGAGDFNTDNETDVVWQHSDGRIKLWLMRASTLLEDRAFDPDRVDASQQVSAVTDIDGDGHSDLVWRHATNGSMGVLFMNGTSVREDQPVEAHEVKDANWVTVGAGDFDGDAYADLLWRDSTTGALSIWFMKGLRQLSSRAIDPESAPDVNWRPVTLGDVNADARADIIWQHADGRLAAWIMNNRTLENGVSLTPAAVDDPAWRIAAGR